MIPVSATTIFLGYALGFSALGLVLWLYPKWQLRARVAQRSLRAFYCSKCGHVCIDRDTSEPVQCLQCGHLNTVIKYSDKIAVTK